jgi:hypothetical protein
VKSIHEIEDQRHQDRDYDEQNIGVHQRAGLPRFFCSLTAI